jgi:hypothetical protein
MNFEQFYYNMHNYTTIYTKLKFKFTQIFLYSIRIKSHLQEKEKEKINLLKIVNEFSHAFLVPAQQGLAHGIDDLA